MTKYLTEQELEKLTTKRLLAYKKKNFKSSDLPHFKYDYMSVKDWDIAVKHYEDTYAIIKRLLATREHIDKD